MLNLTGHSDKRRELEYYPTPANVTQVLIDFLRGQGHLPKDAIIWEPACGDGAISEVLASYGISVVSSDIRDTGYGTGDRDFLTYDLPADAIITNPPFYLSEAFIRHALTLAPLVAMLLKSQYWHAGKRTQLFKEHPPAYVLPLNWRPDFMKKERGGSPVMECCWSVWIHGMTDTRYRILLKPREGGI